VKAVVCDRAGGPEVLRLTDVPPLRPGPQQVLIDVRATALNRADLLQRRGAYPAPPGESEVLGLECSGVIAELGEGCTRFAVGARVMALLGGGGYAEQVVVREELLLAIPERLSFEQAAAVPEAFLTASEALLSEAELVATSSVLITAAASGVGSAAVGIAAQLGALVIASASAAKLAAVARLGARVTIDRDSPDYVASVLAATQGRGVDAIIDFIGGSALARHQACLAARGRLVVVGLLGGGSGALDLTRLLTKRQRVHGLVMRTRSLDDKIALTRRFERNLWRALDSGALSPHVDRVYPLADVALAHRDMEQNLNTGKIVLRVSTG
jgi:putative PIG3 family NAD(P)H quinone oxidoreductase